MIETEFKPYEQEKKYKCILTKDETLLIQKIREVKFGSIIIHKAGGNIVRTETTSSEMMKDIRDGNVKIAIETIIEGN